MLADKDGYEYDEARNKTAMKTLILSMLAVALAATPTRADDELSADARMLYQELTFHAPAGVRMWAVMEAQRVSEDVRGGETRLRADAMVQTAGQMRNPMDLDAMVFLALSELVKLTDAEARIQQAFSARRQPSQRLTEKTARTVEPVPPPLKPSMAQGAVVASNQVADVKTAREKDLAERRAKWIGRINELSRQLSSFQNQLLRNLR